MLPDKVGGTVWVNVRSTIIRYFQPDNENALIWHYCIKGPKETAYEGGYYYGELRFPKDYPFKPPSIIMNTPSGRFLTGKRLW